MAGGFRLLIQHGRETIDLQAAPEETIADVMKKVETLSGVLARQQKLIHRGKLLPSSATVQECHLKSGAKVMLMSSSGGGSTQASLSLGHALTTSCFLGAARLIGCHRRQPQQSSRDACRECWRPRRQQDRKRHWPGSAHSRLWWPRGEGRRLPGCQLPLTRAGRHAGNDSICVGYARLTRPNEGSGCTQEKAKVWAKTGVISARDAGLSELPDILWAVGAAARTADLSGNSLTALPAAVAMLTALTRLRLSHNALISEGMPWDGLAGLPQLTVLALDHNRLVLGSSSTVAALMLVTLPIVRVLLVSQADRGVWCAGRTGQPAGA